MSFILFFYFALVLTLLFTGCANKSEPPKAKGLPEGVLTITEALNIAPKTWDGYERDMSKTIKVAAEIQGYVPPREQQKSGVYREKPMPPYAVFGSKLDPMQSFYVEASDDLNSIPIGTLCILEGQWKWHMEYYYPGRLLFRAYSVDVVKNS